MKAIGQWNTAWDPFFELDPTWTDEFMATGAGKGTLSAASGSAANAVVAVATRQETANSRRLAVRTFRNFAEIPVMPALSSTAASAFDCESAENTGLRTRRFKSALSASMASKRMPRVVAS